MSTFRADITHCQSLMQLVLMTSLLIRQGAPLLIKADGSIHEYCQDETFSASCADDEAIVMTSARYGRMNLGRCVKRSLGFLGCAAEALRFIDSRCSGHRKCDVSIMDPELRALTPCPDDVTWHLEASYDCVEVIWRKRRECHQHNSIRLTDRSGYLSSEVAMTSGVGSSTCPWQIVAPPGQRINVTLYNFVYNSLDGAHERSSSSSNAPCVIVARLSEKSAKKSVTACGKGPRTEVTYISQTNQLTVSFPGITSIAMSASGRTQFLLYYKFLGCPDIPRQDGTSISRSGNTVEIKCIQTGETWFLTCDGTKWNGILGNCSRTTAQTWAIGSIFQSEENFPFGILLVVAVGVALGIFLGGTLLLIVSIYMKRRQRLREARAVLQEDSRRCRGPTEGFYPKQPPLREIDNKDYPENPQSGLMSADDYKVAEFRPPISPSFPQSQVRNVHHVYESPKFT